MSKSMICSLFCLTLGLLAPALPAHAQWARYGNEALNKENWRHEQVMLKFAQENVDANTQYRNDCLDCQANPSRLHVKSGSDVHSEVN